MRALFHVKGVPIGGISIGLALLASMGGFIFGYDTGQISEILLMNDFLLRFAECGTPGDVATCEFPIVREGLIVSLLSIGTLFGALGGAPIADTFGRRNAMSLECLVFIVGVIIQIVSSRAWYQVAIGRLISGLGVGGLSAVVPMYQAETAPPQIRGTLTGTYQLFITFGILVAYCISIASRVMDGSGSWRTVIGFGIFWAMILGVGIQFMPESPRWCAQHELWDEAERSIARIQGLSPWEAQIDSAVQKELNEMREQVHFERHKEVASWLDCFKPEGKMLYRTLLGMSLQSLQQLTGANYFFYYGATVFQSVGIPDSFITQIILGTVNFCCTFLGLYVMEKFGRRNPLVCGGLWQSFWLFVFAAAGTVKNPTENRNIGILMIVSACMFIFGYAATWAPGVWILIGETFAMRSRAKQGALSAASNWFWNFLLAFFTPFIVKKIAFRYGFVFAASNLIGAVIVYVFVYEPAGLSLENVDRMYCNPTCKAWTSKRRPETGYEARQDLVEITKAMTTGKRVEDKRIENTSVGTGGENTDIPSDNVGHTT